MSNQQIPQEIYDLMGKKISKIGPKIDSLMSIVEEWTGNAMDFTTEKYHISINPIDRQPPPRGRIIGGGKHHR